MNIFSDTYPLFVCFITVIYEELSYVQDLELKGEATENSSQIHRKGF